MWVPVLTRHHGICGNWNTTPGDSKKVQKHPHSLSPASCHAASGSRVQTRLRHLEQGWWRFCVTALLITAAPGTKSKAAWPSPVCHNAGCPMEQRGSPGWAVYHCMLSPPLSSLLRGFIFARSADECPPHTVWSQRRVGQPLATLSLWTGDILAGLGLAITWPPAALWC